MRSPILKHILTLLVFLLLSAAVCVYFTKYVDVKIISNKFTPTKEETQYEPEEQEEETTSDTEILEENYSETQAVETDDFILDKTAEYDHNYVEKIVFIGDKNTYTMGRYTYTGIPDPIRQVWSVEQNVSPSKISGVNNFNYAAYSDQTNYLTAIKDRLPTFLVLSFGSYCEENETMTRDRLITSYGDFIINVKRVSPNTQVMIQSISPVTDDCTVLTNEQVLERNEWLKELCNIYKIYYIDSWSVLVDENGNLNTQYASEDGYLLNETGYKTVIDYIKNHAHPVYVNSNKY